MVHHNAGFRREAMAEMSRNLVMLGVEMAARMKNCAASRSMA